MDPLKISQFIVMSIVPNQDFIEDFLRGFQNDVVDACGKRRKIDFFCDDLVVRFQYAMEHGLARRIYDPQKLLLSRIGLYSYGQLLSCRIRRESQSM